MSVEYMTITLSNLRVEDPPTYDPPTTIYVEYRNDYEERIIAYVYDEQGYRYDARLLGYLTGANPDSYRLRYGTFYRGIFHTYGALWGNHNEAFQAALNLGILTGTYVGTYGGIWTIQHGVYDEPLALPSGRGGYRYLTFTEETPTEQFGGEPPVPAQNPSPVDDAQYILPTVPRLAWDAG